MELLTAVIAQEVREAEDGTVDLLGVFEELRTEAVPLTLPRFSVYLTLEFGPADWGQSHIVGLRFTDSDDYSVAPPVGVQVDAPAHDSRTRRVIRHTQNYDGVTFRRMGLHFLDVVYRGRTLRRLSLNLLPFG